MHVVFFPGWYPNRIDAHSGDFIQRHVHAIAPSARLSVVFPAKDNSISKTENTVIENEQLTEYFYYYPSLNGIKWMDNLVSFIRYNYICLKTAKQLHKAEKIDLVHLYVLQKNYLLGFLLKWLYNIPYVVSEQSTIYVDGSFEKMNFLLRKMFKVVFANATSWHGVSAFLVNTIQQKLQPKQKGIVISNVVNTDLFFYSQHTNSQATFVHVSNMFYQKNVEGMLQAFAKAKEKSTNFILNLVGPVHSRISTLIDELGLRKNVLEHGAKTYKEVAAIMQQSDVFVFFTRYETFGCVIIEANACGLPVIVSNLEVTRELVTSNINGLLVENENIQDLADNLIYATENLFLFNSASISFAAINKYNFKKIGQEFNSWYGSCLKSVSIK